MNHLISVWGKDGSGKTTVASNLACVYAKRGARTALVGANRFYGSIQYFFGMEIPAARSLRNVLTGGESLVVRNIFGECPRVKNLYLASLADTDDCAGYRKLRTDLVVRLLGLIKMSFDVAVVDCDESIEDPLSMHSLTNSETVVFVTRPNVQSAVFAEAYKPIVTGLNIQDRLAVALIDDARRGDTAAYSPFGLRCEVLPYCAEIGRADCDAALVALTKGPGRETVAYRRAVGRLADAAWPDWERSMDDAKRRDGAGTAAHSGEDPDGGEAPDSEATYGTEIPDGAVEPDAADWDVPAGTASEGARDE